MGIFKGQLLKVIEWTDSTQNTIVYKFPMNGREIMNGSALTVRESQMAIFVAQGKIGDIFYPGYYKLETKNLPVLTKLFSWKYGFNSPFKAEVYFVNTKQFIDQKWGTGNPIMMRDAEFGAVRIKGYGKYSFKVEIGEIFLNELFGTNSDYTTEKITDYLKSILIQDITITIAESKISVLDLASNYRDFSQKVLAKAQQDFDKIGLKLVNFLFENISLPAEVEKALDKRTEVGIMSDKMGQFMQYQAATAITDAAKNPGGGLAGAGVGLGAGAAMGGMFAQSFQSAMNPPPQPQQQQAAPAQSGTAAKCSKCGHDVKAGAKFCPECGNAMPTERFCSECGEKISATAKFCPGCGKQQ